MKVDEIKQKLTEVGKKYKAYCDIGIEDGFTWITIWGGTSSYKLVDNICQDIANATGRNFYFNSSNVCEVSGALDADFKNVDECGIPIKYPEDEIGEYGLKFEPI